MTDTKEHPIIRFAKGSAVAMKVLTEVIARVEELGLDIQDITVSAHSRSYDTRASVDAGVICHFHDYRIERAVIDLYRRGHKLQRGGWYGNDGRQRNITFIVDNVEVDFIQRERDAKRIERDIALENETPEQSEERARSILAEFRTAQEA